jgi:hypothetical protein
VERVVDLYDGKLPPNVANPEVLEQEKWAYLKR